jgi:hypothetical protein
MTRRKNRLSFAHLLTVVFVLLAAASLAALEIGDAMPKSEAKLRKVGGGETTLRQAVGAKGTLVLFTCNACPWVKAWEERIAALGNEYSKKGIGVIAVNSNDPAVVAEDGFETMEKRARERGFAFPYVVDEGSGLARAFDASRTPEAFLFDGARRLVYHGAVDDNAQSPEAVKQRYLRDALQALLDGEKIPVAETKSLGCTIKFYR